MKEKAACNFSESNMEGTASVSVGQSLQTHNGRELYFQGTYSWGGLGTPIFIDLVEKISVILMAQIVPYGSIPSARN